MFINDISSFDAIVRCVRNVYEFVFLLFFLISYTTMPHYGDKYVLAPVRLCCITWSDSFEVLMCLQFMIASANEMLKYMKFNGIHILKLRAREKSPDWCHKFIA